jgi:hypothetical protein
MDKAMLLVKCKGHQFAEEQKVKVDSSPAHDIEGGREGKATSMMISLASTWVSSLNGRTTVFLVLLPW